MMKNYFVKISLLLCFSGVFQVITGLPGAYGQGVVPDNVEKAALQAIYNATNGASWTEPFRWTQEQIDSYPNSTLHGINTLNGDIFRINLNKVGMSGTLPNELNDLTGLTFISMVDNSLAGTIPDLSALQQLETLNLANNELSGSFPSHIGNLSSLGTLNLISKPSGANYFTGPLPAGYGLLSNLKVMRLSNNDLSGEESIPDTFSSLDNLEFLILRNCKIDTTSVSTGLSGLSSLSFLDLSENNSLYLSGGVFPDILENLPKLNALYLESVGFNKLPGKFDQLLSLQNLRLNDNDYSNLSVLSSIVDTLQNMNLTRLSLDNCQLTGLPSNFSNLTTLEILNIGNNPNLVASEWEIIGQLPALQRIDALYSGLTDLPQSIVNSTTLRTLDLRHNNLYPIPEHIKSIPNLEYLDLGFNGITALPAWFGTANMSTITTLNLRANGLQLPLPASFANLTNLRRLNLSFNQLNGVLPPYFSTFIDLVYLNVSQNLLKSPLPDLSGLTSLEELLLFTNHFTGPLPAYLSATGMVKAEFDFKNNQFDALTPFGNNPNLAVDASNNKLHFDHFVPKPALKSFVIAPQDSIDTKRIQKVPVGMEGRIKALVDTATVPLSSFQWFRYIEGGNDIALTPTPIQGGHVYVLENITMADDSAQFYYQVTNPSDAPGLTLTSRLITLEVTCDIFPSVMDFTPQRYLCAMNFKPDFEIDQPCKPEVYQWDFGDGNTSVDRSAWHAYEQEGTYDVSLYIQYNCLGCFRDTTITKQVVFSLPDEFVVDSLIQVDTDIRTNVINTAVSTFSDAWAMAFPETTLDNRNSYLNGTLGVWRNEGTYVYDVPRELSSETDLVNDGTFDMERFNWQHADADVIPHWLKSNAMTVYSPYSYELENKDVLDVYSAALYDYGGHLPAANGVNMRNNEMAFTGFEYFDNYASGNWRFNNQAIPAYSMYNILLAIGHMAVVEASPEDLQNVSTANVLGLRYDNPLSNSKIYNYIGNNQIICTEAYPENPSWTLVVFRRALFDGLWEGRMQVRNTLTPGTLPVIDNLVAHTGEKSLKITGSTNFKQELLQLDSAKTYVINAWVSVNNMHLMTPQLGEGISLEVILKNKEDQPVLITSFVPQGRIIEGWQQLKGKFVCPDKETTLELNFNSGNAAAVWFDDLRLHPELGNMKSYVYDLKDYRLQAVLDEENFASYYYYDEEGNLYLTKKETERGIQTISENVSYILENNPTNPGN